MDISPKNGEEGTTTNTQVGVSYIHTYIHTYLARFLFSVSKNDIFGFLSFTSSDGRANP